MSESRYDGFPQVFLSGDKEKALAHLGRAKSLLSEVQKLREVMGVAAHSKTISLDGGVSITATSRGSVNQLYVDVSPGAVEPEEPVGYDYPVVLSGYIDARLINTLVVDEEFVQASLDRKIARLPDDAPEEDKFLTADELEAARYPTGFFAPTLRTVRAYGDYLEEQHTGPFKSSALRADPNSTFSGYGLNRFLENGAELKYRAYRAVRAPIVTGALSECLQCVLGLHLSAVGALLRVPEFLATEDAVRGYMAGNPHETLANPDYVDSVIKSRGFVSEYSNTWGDSCGLVRGYKQWWLVKVTQTRILARRLPVFFGSNAPEYSGHYRSLGLEHLAEFIEKFHGLPTGEGIPSGQTLDTLLATGQVLDITPDDMPFASGGWYGLYNMCGWSFSDQGYEAHNTAMRYVPGAPGQDVYESCWASLYFKVNTDGRRETITAEAKVNRVDRLYRPPYFQNSKLYQDIPLKVPAGPGQEVVSVTVDTEDGNRQGSSRNERFNAVVWAGFVGGVLQTISYYYNGLESTRSTSYGEAPPACSFSGAWEWGTKSGVGIMPPVMFSNVWDQRKTLDGAETKETLTSRKVGEYISGGNLIPDVEWSYYRPYAQYLQTAKTWTYGGDDLKARITIHQDRSFYTASSLHTWATQQNYREHYYMGHAEGKWVGFGFRCFVGINMSNKPVCVTAMTPSQVMDICNQRCNFMAIGAHSDSTNRHLCHIDNYPKCRDFVDALPPSRCSDVDKFMNLPQPQYPLPGDISDNQIKYEQVTNGCAFLPEASRGFRYTISAGDMAVGTEIGSPSPNPWVETINLVASARNVNGYVYACFSKHLLGTLGYAKIGRLHAGDGAMNPNITFVGVLGGG